MKKLLYFFAATFIIVSAANAQADVALKKEIKNEKKDMTLLRTEKSENRKELRKLEGKEVSYQAKEAFYRDFGNVPVSKWERELNFDVANYSKDGIPYKAYYDFNARLVGTIVQKKFTDLPLVAQKFINNRYRDYKKTGVILFDDNQFNQTDMMLYGQQFDDEDNYFVELKKGDKEIVLKVNMEGNVSFFKQLR